MDGLFYPENIWPYIWLIHAIFLPWTVFGWVNQTSAKRLKLKMPACIGLVTLSFRFRGCSSDIIPAFRAFLHVVRSVNEMDPPLSKAGRRPTGVRIGYLRVIALRGGGGVTRRRARRGRAGLIRPITSQIHRKRTNKTYSPSFYLVEKKYNHAAPTRRHRICSLYLSGLYPDEALNGASKYAQDDAARDGTDLFRRRTISKTKDRD